MNIEDAFIAAVLVLFGFLLNAAWEGYRARRQRRRERLRLLATIRMEVEMNAGACTGLMKAVDDRKLESLTSIPLLRNHGWLLATSNWLALELDPKTAVILAQIYQKTDEINSLIQIRDHFQVSMMALSTYTKVLVAFSKSLKDKCQLFVDQADKFTEEFKRLWARDSRQSVVEITGSEEKR